MVDFGIALTADDVKKLTKEGYVIGFATLTSVTSARVRARHYVRAYAAGCGESLLATMAAHLSLNIMHGLGGAAFVHYQPPALSGDNGPFDSAGNAAP